MTNSLDNNSKTRMQGEGRNGSLLRSQRTISQDESSIKNSYVYHLSKMPNSSQNSQVIHSIGAMMQYISQEKEGLKVLPPGSIKQQGNRKETVPIKVLSNADEYKFIYRKQLRLAHQQTALILTNNRKEQISSKILNKILQMKLKQLESKQFNNQSVQLQLSKDQQQLSQLHIQQQENQCLRYKYLSQKYKCLCQINKQLLEQCRLVKAHQS